jgi:adenylate cyclase
LVKTIDDAVMLAADTPDAMLATIIALSDEAASQIGFLALRAGIHHGAAVAQDGDLFGHTVNIAARITALAGAGQAVNTNPVLPAAARIGLPTTALGPRGLRNISAPVELHTVALTPARYPRDPVCGARVDPATAPECRQTADGQWCFCSTDCAERFNQPEQGDYR